VSTTPRSPEDLLWYKDAIIYELHVRAFADSNGDGIGDFAGLTGKLDYLQDLGINTIWLLPFYPSPLKDDGYDISDYTQVHPDYGTLTDFKNFLREAHRRGLRVITELVLNHTSDRHPWFQRARQAPAGSRWRGWYVWSQTTEQYRDVRVIFKDFEPSNWSWDPVAKAYYWHRFYSHQPDLNFEHPDVHKAMFQIVDFWLDLGVDGFRLDAIPYLYERDGTSCENLPETHEFLRKLRKHVDDHYPHRVLLAEANQWPEDAIAYFGRGDECNMAFHFPIMARMFLAVHMEDRHPLLDILAQTPPIPETAQWALFLRNHDELTLEMVTDEERDYMYRVYARERQARINLGIRRRLAPLLQNNRKKMELLNALLFSLPGTPVIYYGDEIGMGDNIFLGDRDGVRTPMQWSGDRNAGFSRANAQRVYLPAIVDPEYHYEAVNVETQQANSQSLLWWMKRLLALSRRWKAFGRGTMELLTPDNRKVLAFLRRYQDEVILVVTNLSRFSQYVELDLNSCIGRLPVELFGHTEFPKIGPSPYVLTLGPHAFYWFALQPPREAATALPPREPARTLEVAGSWLSILDGKFRKELEKGLEFYLLGRPWFASRAFRMKAVRISESVPLGPSFQETALLRLEVEFFEGEPEAYSVPLRFISGATAERIKKETPEEVIVDLTNGVLVDALTDEGFARSLLELLARRQSLRSPSGRISGLATPHLSSVPIGPDVPLSLTPLKSEPLTSALSLGNRLTLTWFRRIEEGCHPDLEASQALARRDPAPPILPLAGHLELLRKGQDPVTLGLLRLGSPGSSEGWDYTLDELGRYFETVRSTTATQGSVAAPEKGIAWSLTSDLPQEMLGGIGPYLDAARKMGECTARVHLAFGEPSDDPAFKPESITPVHQRSIYQSLRKKITRVLQVLRRTLRQMAPESSVDPKRILALETRLLETFQAMLKRPLRSVRILCHGDLNLHHLLSTGSDFVITDWSGPSTASFLERRIKRSPLWDVAGMLNSFRSAANTALHKQTSSGEVSPDRWPVLENGGAAWTACVSTHYVKAYLKTMDGRLGLGNTEEAELLLRTRFLEKMMDELAQGSGSPGVRIPLVLKTLIDLVAALENFVPTSSGVGVPSGAWPEGLEWMSFLRSLSRPPAPVGESPPPGTPLGPPGEAPPAPASLPPS
jgi:maltose alpha-D-glucosyltransferase/alpha-amylase